MIAKNCALQVWRWGRVFCGNVFFSSSFFVLAKHIVKYKRESIIYSCIWGWCSSIINDGLILCPSKLKTTKVETIQGCAYDVLPLGPCKLSGSWGITTQRPLPVNKCLSGISEPNCRDISRNQARERNSEVQGRRRAHKWRWKRGPAEDRWEQGHGD